jgi:MFS family permease
MNPTPTGPYAALFIRDFRLFILSRFCVTLAIQIQSVVVAWQVYEITKDPWMLGLIGLAEAIPSILVSLYAGHIADVVERKRIIVICLFALAMCSGALLLLTTPLASGLLTANITPIYLVIIISGLARGFLTPAVFSFMPQLVSRELYPNAITWNSTLWETASISGLAFGGVIFGFFGVTTAYSIDFSLMLIGLTSSLLIARKPLPPHSNDESTLHKIWAGLKFVFDNKIILSAITLDLFAVLFGGAVGLLPFFADKILHVGSEGLGILRAAPSIGALIMAFYITHHPIRKHAGPMLLSCVAGFGACMILFGISENFWLSLTLLVLSGAFDCVSVIIRGTLLQTLTPENMKGRVSAVNNIFIGSSNEIGIAESGYVAKKIGVISSVVVGGFLTLGVVGITTWVSKSIRKLQTVE